MTDGVEAVCSVAWPRRGSAYIPLRCVTDGVEAEEVVVAELWKMCELEKVGIDRKALQAAAFLAGRSHAHCRHSLICNVLSKFVH